MTEAARAPYFQIDGAEGTTIRIPDGEYYINAKARCRRMMLDSLSSEARQVYACLELATIGFHQELAVTMEGGRKRPLTPSDISRQTGLLKQNVRRALAELEAAGLALRVAADGGPLRNGQILIYSWAVPRTTEKEKGSRARLPFPAWFPPSWEPLKPLITRLKLEVSIGEVAARDYFETGAVAARDYEKAEKAAARFLKGICARSRPNKEERKERTPERTSSSGASPNSRASTPGTTTTASASSYQPEAGATTGTARARERSAENLDPILDAFESRGGTDDEYARQLLAACRKVEPGCTVEEVSFAVATKLSGAKAGSYQSPTGWARAAVPKLFEPGVYRRLRQRMVSAAEARSQEEAYQARQAAQAAELDMPPLCAECKDGGGTVWKPCKCPAGDKLREYVLRKYVADRKARP